MDEKKMIDDLVQMLDSGMLNGVGHVNVDFDDDTAGDKDKDDGASSLYILLKL